MASIVEKNHLHLSSRLSSKMGAALVDKLLGRHKTAEGAGINSEIPSEHNYDRREFLVINVS